MNDANRWFAAVVLAGALLGSACGGGDSGAGQRPATVTGGDGGAAADAGTVVAAADGGTATGVCGWGALDPCPC